MADTVISALDVRDSDLSGVLATKSLLLVLDNCEHVVDQVAELAGQLLRAALAARRTGRLDLAEAHLDHILADPPRNDPDPPVHLTMLLTELGFIAELRGRPDQALALHLESFAAAEKLDAPRDKVGALEGLAGALTVAGRSIAAAQILGAASAARRSSSLPAASAEQADLDRITAACREHLPEETFAAAFARGAGLTPEQARNLACPT